MKKIKVISVFGTRPEAIKMAPLVLELGAREDIDSLVCVTAQHRQMLDSVLDVFGITADYDLDIMEPQQTLNGITARVLTQLAPVLQKEKPDLVLVHGDTSTTFSAALAAFYEKIPVGHVEAGLRSFDRYSPFPEEMNRLMTADLSTLHFSPTRKNAENLRREGVKDGIFVTGNTVIDAMRYTVGSGKGFQNEFLAKNDFSGKRVIAMTCHRRENYGEAMENIFLAVREIIESREDTELVYPVHLSPTVQDTAKKFLSGHERIHLIAPLDAMDMHKLIAESYLVMTDSGGIQEEAPALGKPVIVLRRETERPEAVDAGTVLLAGVERDKIRELTLSLLDSPEKYASMAHAVNPYGDGKACPRIAEAIRFSFGLTDVPPEEFSV